MHPLGDIVSEFLLECHENLHQLDQDFVRLEQAPKDREILSAIYRVVHTLKSSSGFLSFKRLETLAHAGENLLGCVRDGGLALTPQIFETLLNSVDRIRAILRHLEEKHSEGEGDDSEILRALTELTAGKSPAKGAATATKPPTAAIPVIITPTAANRLPLPARDERGEGSLDGKEPSSPRPSPPAAGGEGDRASLVVAPPTDSRVVPPGPAPAIGAPAPAAVVVKPAAVPTASATPTAGATPADATSGTGEIDELTREFLIESTENLDALDRSFVLLEKTPGDRNTLASIFRTLHTVKGTSGFFGFGRLERLAHAAENLLGKLRAGELLLNADMTAALLDTADTIRGVLRHIETTGKEPTTDHRDLMDSLNQLASGSSPSPRVPRPAPLASAPFNLAAAIDDALANSAPASPPAEKKSAAVAVPPAVVAAAPTPPVAPPPPSPPPAPKAVPTLDTTTAAPTAPGASAGETRSQSIADTSIRVDVSQLDKLMNLVGELVLARNRLMPFAANHPNTAFVAATQGLNQITSELQERVMKTRMQPIGNVWSKLPRLVRDIAAHCAKQVALEFEGQDTELDRSLIEAIKDPLTHIIRNAVDHGIETPARRAELGKPVVGRLHLRAFHEGGQVVMEINDDGGGIDLARVRHKAVEKEMLSAAEAEALSDRQALELIFLPGFSTAEKTTTVSGRGVGMDVVKTNIENIGGTLDLQTRLGEGTTLRLKIPLTLAIIPALRVSCGGERFAIPQTGLVELVRLDGDQDGASIEMVYGAPVVRLRGKLLPLVFLGSELKLNGAVPETNANPAGTAQNPVNIVVLQADTQNFGVVVDEVHDTEEIVVKPLGKLLKGIPCFAGGTILGDGRVALILDVVGLALHAGVVEKIRDRAFSEEIAAPVAAVSTEQSLLLFDLGAGERMGIPIEMVARLERFPSDQITRSGGGEVIEYHSEILPLMRANEYVAGSGALPVPADGVFDVVVVAARGRRAGLVVGRIHDIVSEPLKVQPWVGRRGLLGSAIVQEQVTALLDIPGILCEAQPDAVVKLS